MPTRVTLSGRAAAYRGEPEIELTDAGSLQPLDGLTYDEDVCSRYLYDPQLEKLGIDGGAVRVTFDPEAGELRVVTEYLAPRELKPAELQALIEETTGQWSDGIGEGCFDAFAAETGIRIDLSPFDRERDLRVTQETVAGPSPKKPSPLFASAKSGNLKRLTKLLDAGEDPNVVDKHGFTPLAYTLHGEHTEAARLLIERGASVQARADGDFCPLTTATVKGNVEIAQLMLEKGADVNGRVTAEQDTVQYSPLMMACNRRQWEVGRLLLEHGADVNLRDSTGYTPLLMLDERGLEFARLLVERGADLNARNDFCKVDPELRKALSG